MVSFRGASPGVRVAFTLRQSIMVCTGAQNKPAAEVVLQRAWLDFALKKISGAGD
jgi:hypothetical protein